MMRLTTLVSLLAGAAADCYLQYPPGSNNRLDEGGGNRNNNNRLMDTQNNAKGGYGYGGDANNQAAAVKYMAGSEVSTMWTAQHSCGSANNECQIVVQAMCNPNAATPAGVPGNANGAGEGPLRDGTDNGTPDPNNPDADTGLHEPASFYAACAARDRNKGLYTADQNMNNNQGAQATRQNPNGNRSGQECPEERDYYPYWHPSPWKDLAVMTNNLALCQLYQTESQNVKAKNYCDGDDSANNAQDCQQGGGTWTEQAPFNIPPPECITAPVQRDNHLGSGPTGQEVMYNWTVNSAFGVNAATDDATNCVMRFRYNITTADTQVCEDASINTKAACEAAGKIWSAAYLTASSNNAVQGNNNIDPSTSNPPLMQQNPDTSMGGFLNDGGGTDSLLELAVNTNQYGRTFQDRTHVMEIQARPPAVSASTKVYNLNVKGKRGNIVQTYPATEYDFTPVDLVVGMNDMVHVQWTGNDDTNNNGNNNGEGTDSEDRHNIVQLSNSGLDSPMNQQSADQANMFDVAWEWNPEGGGEFSGSRDKANLVKQFALSKQTNCDTNPNNDQDANNCQKLNAAAATVDLGMLKFKPGEFKYMSSRNMNFSNRAQKATLKVLSTPSVVPKPPVAVQVNTVDSGGDENKKALEVSWSKPGARDPSIGFDGKEYWGMEQLNTPVAQYSVSYSIDGGKEWIAGPAECAQSPCTIKDLPAGTNALVKVNAWGQAGEGEPSEYVAAQTEDSDYSRECRETLLAKADGSYVAPGTIVAAVFGALAFLCLCGGVAYYFKRQKDSNVPPPPKAPGAAY